MPQMAPLSWFSLYIFFTLMFIIFNSINYYSFIYEVKVKSSFSKKSYYNWKW